MLAGGDDEAAPMGVYRENWLALNICWATWHQWKTKVINNTTVRTGMDWAQVESALNLSGIKRANWPVIFEGLRAIQEEYLNPKKS